MTKRQRWIEVCLIVMVVGASLYAAFSDAHNFPNRWFTRDDAYYYFKVAQNISEGHGSTFDGVNPANGYHPLWMLVCVPIFALARYNLILPLRILLIVMGILQAATGILLYRLIRKILHEAAAVLIAAFWILNLYIHGMVVQYGLETGLTTFSLVLFLSTASAFEEKIRQNILAQRDWIKLALLAVLLIFSRLDTVFVVLAVGLYFVFRGTPMRHLLLWDILGIVVTSFASFILRVGMKSYYPFAGTAVALCGVALMLTLPAYYFSGLYHTATSLNLWRKVVAAVGTLGLVAVIMFALEKAGLVSDVSGSALGIFIVTALVWTALGRLLWKVFSSPQMNGEQTPLQQFGVHWKGWLSEGALYYGVIGGFLGAYMLFSKLVFGTTTPVSGQVKRWWGRLPGNVYGGPARQAYTFFGLDTSPASDVNAWGLFSQFVSGVHQLAVKWFHYSALETAIWPIFGAIVIGIMLILIASRRRTARAASTFGLLPLFAGSVLQIVSYNAMGYSAAKEWYWVGQLIFTLLLSALLLDILFRWLAGLHRFAYVLVWGGVLVVTLLLGRTYYAHIIQLMPYGVAYEGHPYMDILAVVEENTEPSSLIGMTGGGNLGYFITDRTIVNMDGLINSYAYFQAHQRQQADDFLAAMGLDYIFVNPALLMDVPYKGEYEDRLGDPIATYGKKSVLPFLNP